MTALRTRPKTLPSAMPLASPLIHRRSQRGKPCFVLLLLTLEGPQPGAHDSAGVFVAPSPDPFWRRSQSSSSVKFTFRVGMAAALSIVKFASDKRTGRSRRVGTTPRKGSSHKRLVENGFHETLPAAEVQDPVMDFLGGSDVTRRDVTFDVPSFLSLDSANNQQQAH